MESAIVMDLFCGQKFLHINIPIFGGNAVLVWGFKTAIFSYLPPNSLTAPLSLYVVRPSSWSLSSLSWFLLLSPSFVLLFIISTIYKYFFLLWSLSTQCVMKVMLLFVYFIQYTVIDLSTSYCISPHAYFAYIISLPVTSVMSGNYNPPSVPVSVTIFHDLKSINPYTVSTHQQHYTRGLESHPFFSPFISIVSRECLVCHIRELLASDLCKIWHPTTADVGPRREGVRGGTGDMAQSSTLTMLGFLR